MVYTADLKSAAFGIEGSSPSAHTIIISINISMQNFYKRFPEIDNVYWTNYFLNEFFPKNKFSENPSTNTSYISYFKKDFNDKSKILELSSLLTKKLKFPPIEYFLIFKHNNNQPIHADGKLTLRYASFNLPLVGFEGDPKIPSALAHLVAPVFLELLAGGGGVFCVGVVFHCLGFVDLWLHRFVQHARAFDHPPGPVGFGLWFVFDRHSGHHVPQLGAVVG